MKSAKACGELPTVCIACCSSKAGSDVNPISDGDLEQKLRTVAAGWDPRHDIAPLIEAIWSLDKSADVSALASLAVPRS
jgi:hypothetical protein